MEKISNAEFKGMMLKFLGNEPNEKTDKSHKFANETKGNQIQISKYLKAFFHFFTNLFIINILSKDNFY